MTELLNVNCLHENVLLYGRYRKTDRAVSQTPWSVEGGEGIVHTSVEAEIGKCVKQYFLPSTDEMYLHAAGREDIDVRMLGRGRPFVFEFVNPRRAYSCYENVDKIKVESPYVSCTDFKIVDKSFFDRLKEIEGTKAKSYAAVICSKVPFTQSDADILNK